ncbi:MAG: ACP S-malonyltransferase [Chitinophagales bacterium]|nr:ACP S-malonyltransferase [Chitinophagales bacterium]MDW8394500.1 ACP S-malonyltransferase [Chitinophagales bacterium]
MKAYLYPGQGFQYVGMGKRLYDEHPAARDLFEYANELLGFRITDIMFQGPEEKLLETTITQNAIFLVSLLQSLKDGSRFQPDCVAGHSLGETTALVACQALSFEDGLLLMAERSVEMEKAFRAKPAKMVAILGMSDEQVVMCLRQVEGLVVPANYNCPGQLVIAGEKEAVEEACEILRQHGARRLVELKVGGAVHSPLMQPVADYLEKKLRTIEFRPPVCPIYPNVTGKATTDVEEIRNCLILQQVKPLLWQPTIENMIYDGVTEFVDCGPPHVISGMVRRINAEVAVTSSVYV